MNDLNSYRYLSGVIHHALKSEQRSELRRGAVVSLCRRGRRGIATPIRRGVSDVGANGPRLHISRRHAEVFRQLNFQLVTGANINLLTFLGAQDRKTNCYTNASADQGTASRADRA
jgi:hypothetical protein